jgi:hypothetical protein
MHNGGSTRDGVKKTADSRDCPFPGRFFVSYSIWNIPYGIIKYTGKS